MSLDAEERATIAALYQWLEDNPASTEDGQPHRWADGRPVALDRLRVIQAIRDSQRQHAEYRTWGSLASVPA